MVVGDNGLSINHDSIDIGIEFLTKVKVKLEFTHDRMLPFWFFKLYSLVFSGGLQ